MSFVEYTDAVGEVTAEIHIGLNSGNCPHLRRIKLIAPYGVALCIDDETTTFTNLSYDVIDDAYGDMMDTLEDRHNH